MRARSDRPARSLPIRWQAYALAALVFLGILFGGGGIEGPVNNGVIQALSALLLALLFASHAQGTWPLPSAALGFIGLLLGLLVIALLQLVPLPPSLWSSLPDRELAASAFALAGASDSWHPLSVDPEATRRLAASLLLPSAIIYGLLGTTRREALLVVRAVVIAAGVSALIGALQLTLGNPAWLTYYEGPNSSAASGVFANANHHAAMLAAAILCLAFLIRADRSTAARGSSRGGGPIHPAWLALPFLVAITIATGSRAGMVLLLIAIPGALLITIGGRSPMLWLGGFAAAVAVTALVILFSPSGNLVAAGQSFIFSEDSRYAFLPDVLYTIRQYWPSGSGLGTFVQAFAPNENLDVASAGYVNRAHNDLLEWLLEAGLLGAFWLAALIAVLLWRIVGVARRRRELRGSQFAAVLTGALLLIILALHSLVDYPIRIAAISAVLAVGGGLIFTPLTDAPPRQITRRSGGRWMFGAGAVAGLAVGALTLRIFLAEAAVRQDNAALAQMLRPQSGAALGLAAEQQLILRNMDAARQLARSAIEQAPLNAAAVRVLAMSLPPGPAVEPWRVASAMGWRDGPTQLWALQQALVNGEFPVAAVRADAFLRTRSDKPQNYLTLVRTAALEPRFRAAITERLKLNPAWRASFFAVPQDASEEELQGTSQVLAALAAANGQPTLGEASAAIARLIDRGQYAAAVAIYRQVGGTQPAELLADGGFDRPVDDYRTNSTPFDWQIEQVRGGTASIEGQDGKHLFLETGGSAARTLVRRYVPLPPGPYRLDYMRRGERESPEAIAVSIRCADGRQIGAGSRSPLQSEEFERRGISFEVGPNCPMIAIAFEAKPVGRPATAEFDDFTLRQAP